MIDQVTPRQRSTIETLRCWLSINGTPRYLYQVDNAIPADISDPINVIWNHHHWIRSGDPLDVLIRGLGIPLPQLGVLECKPIIIIVTGIPVNITLPIISGVAQVGQLLTASTGTWTNSPSSYTYQWYKIVG